jgi:glycosyltransferase involved in cell wall biosynthesis
MSSPQQLRIAMVGLRGIPATYGGVEKAVEGLAVELARMGHHVTVYGRRAYCDTSVTSYEGVRLKYLPQINTKHLEAVSHTALALAHVLGSREYDLVHIHATGPALLSFLPRVLRLPTIATVQGLDFRREKWGALASQVLKMGALAAARVPTRTIVVSRELRRHFAETYGTATTYIPNGVDTADLSERTPVDGLEADQFVLYLGRLVPEKHIHTLIDAHARSGLDVPLAIAGPSSHSDAYVSALREQAAGMQNVIFLGPRYGSEKAWLLANAGVFVQPSSIEGLPIALLEALACGTFPVTSNIPENLEPITTDDGTLGLHAPVGDADALGQRLREAFSLPDRHDRAAALQRNVETTYNWPAIARKTHEVYMDAVPARNPGRRG